MRHDEPPRASAGRAAAAAIAVAVLALGLVAGPTAAQAVPPNVTWRTIQTQHFRVTFSPGLDGQARVAAAVAESAYTVLARDLKRAPGRRIDIAVADQVDFSNGLTRPFPSDRIVLFVRPPTESRELQYDRSWMELVVVHELTHAFHLNATGGLGHLARSVFGRIPSSWPLFPVVNTPAWSTEGLAVYYESNLTGGGRINGSYQRMVVRTAILEHRVPNIDHWNGVNPVWPAGQRPYVYGSFFREYLARRFGPGIQARLLGGTTSAWIPPFLWFDRVGERVTGQSFDALYRDWITQLTARTDRLADSLTALGLTESEPVVTRGPFAVVPRVSPDGRWLSFTADDDRSATATRLVDLRSGAVHTLGRRNSLDAYLGPASWLPNGSGVVFAQLDFDDRYHVFDDLYTLDLRGHARRLTHRARLAQPDVAPDGTIVALQTVDGMTRLVTYDTASRALTPLTPLTQDVAWSMPRFSPDGRSIAVGRWSAGGYYDIALVAPGGGIRLLTHDRAINAGPAWSPDGRWILFSSDRSGIANLYAVDPHTGRTRQVTNVLTGAFNPEVTPDGRWIYFVHYHADGYHIERMPFDTTTWREPGPLRQVFQPAQISAVPVSAAATRVPAPEPYSAWPTLRPFYWMPTVAGDRRDGLFWGVQTSGTDLIGRHAYDVAVARQFRYGWWQGHIAYAYAGLGNPTLGLTAERTWDRWGGSPVLLTDSSAAVPYTRENRIALAANFVRRRWRAAEALAVGTELSDQAFVVPGRNRTLLPYYDPPRRVSLVVQPSFANYQVHPYSISREDGIAAQLTARRWWQVETYGGPDQSYDELRGRIEGYKSLDLPGFAHHVLAARFSALARFGPGASPENVGGFASSGQAAGITFGSNEFLPVRGFQSGDRTGDRAWSATAEYRFPLVLRRPYQQRHFDFDRLHGALFFDVGNAYCAPGSRFAAYCSPAGAPPLASTGAQLALDLTLFDNIALGIRAGLAVPVSGGRNPSLYLGLNTW
ncbi:MAG: hypothetical protein P8099_04290 [Gemmatimonadota bacterium]